ncbi:MAG: LacI family transcriptional regulator [Spirochaetales bacterium]|nr:MAG: LacI family transcriptional regulator [Spirochaetales bacterium]
MTGNPAATIYDVADQAGVSISTVSRYLNNPGKVAVRTGERIKTAMDGLSYIRHGNAGTRLSRQAGRIGVLAPFFPAPSFVERMQGMSPVLHEARCEMLIYSIDSPEQLNDYVRSGIFERRLDGIIVMAMLLDEGNAHLLHHAGMHVVLIEQHNPLFCSIECDNIRGGALAAEYFLSKGYESCGYIGQRMALPYSLQPSELRIKGYEEALKGAGHELRQDFIRLGEVSVEDGLNMALDLLGRPDRPRAVFTMSDLQAFGVIKAARKLALRVPQDIAILGFDDIEAADYMELSTISQSLKESGRLAAEQLLGRIREPERPLRNVQLRVSVVERSTA